MALLFIAGLFFSYIIISCLTSLPHSSPSMLTYFFPSSFSPCLPSAPLLLLPLSSYSYSCPLFSSYFYSRPRTFHSYSSLLTPTPVLLLFPSYSYSSLLTPASYFFPPTPLIFLLLLSSYLFPPSPFLLLLLLLLSFYFFPPTPLFLLLLPSSYFFFSSYSYSSLPIPTPFSVLLLPSSYFIPPSLSLFPLLSLYSYSLPATPLLLLLLLPCYSYSFPHSSASLFSYIFS